MEAGLKLSIEENQKPTFEYLSKRFPTNYVVGDDHPELLNISLSHSTPLVKIGDYGQPLLFPDSVIAACKSFWPNARDTEYLFIGLITPEREKVLSDCQRRLEKINPSSRVLVKNSSRGREFPEKAWDEDYYREMAKTKFVLCPNGDFVWTYRFFEAILCGAVPIVQSDCSLYEGFQYYTMESAEFRWTEQIASSNYVKAVELIGPPKDIKSLLGL
jgi:hypothetical protein